MPAGDINDSGVDEALIPVAQDQGQIGDCVYQTQREVVEGLERKPAGAQRLYSALFGYYFGRALEGTSPTDDAGSQVATAFEVLDKVGIPFKSTWDDDQPFSREPSVEAFDQAAQHKSLLHLPLPNLMTMKACVDAGFPFAFGMDVSQQLMGDHAAATGMVEFPAADSDFLPEGHAMSAWQRSDTIKIGRSVGGFLVLNHWSKDWGLNGRAWVAYDYFLSGRATDAHTARRVVL